MWGIDKLDDGIVKAFETIIVIIGLIVGAYFLSYIGAIILGSVFQTVQEGNLPVTNNTTNLLNTMEAGFISTFTSVNSAILFTASLIVVVVVVLIFGGMLKKSGSKSGKDY